MRVKGYQCKGTIYSGILVSHPLRSISATALIFRQSHFDAMLAHLIRCLVLVLHHPVSLWQFCKEDVAYSSDVDDRSPYKPHFERFQRRNSSRWWWSNQLLIIHNFWLKYDAFPVMNKKVTRFRRFYTCLARKCAVSELAMPVASAQIGCHMVTSCWSVPLIFQTCIQCCSQLFLHAKHMHSVLTSNICIRDLSILSVVDTSTHYHNEVANSGTPET